MNDTHSFPIFLVIALLLTCNTTSAQMQGQFVGSSASSITGFSWPVAEIESLREETKNIFAILDANNSGSITLDEIDILQELIEGEEVLPTEKLAELRQRSNIISRTFMYLEEEVDQFEVTDTDKNGTLSEDEFDRRETTLRTHILQRNIDSFDKNKNGGVELIEFSAHLDNIEELDKDGDGRLSRAELQQSDSERIMRDVHMNHWQSQVRQERRDRQRQIEEEEKAKRR